MQEQRTLSMGPAVTLAGNAAAAAAAAGQVCTLAYLADTWCSRLCTAHNAILVTEKRIV
jgi:hypothetical protein